MLEIIKELLLKIVSDINSGNSNITEKDATEIIEVIKNLTDKTQRLSKYQACQKLNISRATFDSLVRKGEIPRGTKIAGYKELFWLEKDLKQAVENRRKKK
jgi:predicted DNA-binding transcriptional regulator AlpA